MNFIDISSWQAGLDLSGIFAANPALSGVIVKLTQGTGYVNPEAKGWLDWLRANGKPFGTYHYLDGSGAEREARHYAEALKAYPGGVPALDYEDVALAQGTPYVKACLDEVYRLTGVKPLVYCSQSVTQAQPFSRIAEAGYKLWVAQYADMNPVHSFVDKPWHSGSVAPFDGFVMQQYTSCGRLSGWGGNLDFNKFFGTAADWQALAGNAEPLPELKGPDPEVIADVLAGKYSIGAERVAKLIEAGYNPESVQAKVNELYAIAQSCKKYVAGNDDYLGSIAKIIGLL